MLLRFIMLLGILFAPLSDTSASSKKPKYTLSIAAVFQDEARFLKEWIDFHKIVGVEHFWLYNNNSQDNYREILAPYVKDGVVELIELKDKAANLAEWNTIQCKTFMNAIRKSRSKSQWVAFIDIDEFLFPCKGDSLPIFLEEFKPYGALAVNWQGFGTSNVQKVPENGLMIELLCMRNPPEKEFNQHVKCIVNPKRVIACSNPHFFSYRRGYLQVTSKHVPFTGPFSPTIDPSDIRINHYWTRDEEFLHNNKIPRGNKWDVSAERTLRLANELNFVFDDAILRFVPMLKK